jgi:uncharacterized protein (DUF305 family)
MSAPAETLTPEQPAATRPAPRWPRTALMAVIAVGLLLLGGGAAVALGIGRTTTPDADSVDAGFAWDMSRHHLQGIEMANLAPDHSQDPIIRSLAFDISATQTNQVGRMQGWLALWGLPNLSGRSPMYWMGGMPASSSMPDMAGMTMADDGPGTLMPGMATNAEMAHLRSLSGKAWDVEFLRLMIRHHQGGLKMAQYAAQHAQEPSVRTLAESMALTQTAEVHTMAQLRAERGGTPLPAP